MTERARHPGVWVALDWGKARIGVAACDRDGSLAYPVSTVGAKDRPIGKLTDLIHEMGAERVFIGLPVDLKGRESLSAQFVLGQAALLYDRVWPPIYLLDERLSTVMASHKLDHTGRDTRQKRDIIDQAAAVEILNLALDRFRAGDLTPGELLSDRLSSAPDRGRNS